MRHVKKKLIITGCILAVLIVAVVIIVLVLGGTPAAVRAAPHGCAQVQNQLLTYAHQTQNSNVIKDIMYNDDMITSLRRDIADPATPNSLAQPEIRLADALQTYNLPAAKSTVSQIAAVCRG